MPQLSPCRPEFGSPRVSSRMGGDVFGPRIRVPSYAGIDDACSDLLDNLDPELLVPLDLPSDVPFKPRLTEIKVQLFLRAMLKCAPLFGRSYIVKNVLSTRGAEAKLQRLAGVWFNRIVFLARALYLPARPPDQPEEVYIDPLQDFRLHIFRDKLRERDAWHTTITRQADAHHFAPSKANKGVQTTPVHIVPKISSLSIERDEAFSWELLGNLSGIDPRELVGELAHRTCNGLLVDSDERALFSMLAWYLEPELDFNSSPIPHHYIFRRLLNSKGIIEQHHSPILLRNHNDLSRSEDLPDPRYLALHAAIGGVLVKSGCVFYVMRLFDEMRKAMTLAPDGSSNIVHLFASHSIGKLFTI